MATITAQSWEITCKICTVIRNIAISIFMGMVAMGESAGRARAAAELSRQGYYKEAKALMLEYQKNLK